MNHPMPTTRRRSVEVVQSYLDDLARGDTASAQARFGQDLTYQAPGHNQLAGQTSGPDAAGRWFAAMADLSGGTYAMTAPLDWLASENRALLLAREHGTVSGRDHDWTRAVVFTVEASVITQVQLFEDDQLAYDAWLTGGSAGRAADPMIRDEPAPDGPPEMTGELDDPRVRAVLSYQRQVAAGDIEANRVLAGRHVHRPRAQPTGRNLSRTR